MSDRRTKILQAQLKKAMSEDHPNILFSMDEKNMGTWYMMVVGLPYPYVGGEFIFKLEMPDEFPRKPPSLKCLTPNGVFEPGPRICISIGEYHSRDFRDKTAAAGGDWGWRPALGIIGFAREVVNGLITPSSLNTWKHPDSLRGGIGVLDEPNAERVKFARKSREFNQKMKGNVFAMFEEQRILETEKPSKALVAWRRQVLKGEICQQVATGEKPSPALDAETAKLDIGVESFSELLRINESCPGFLELYDVSLVKKLVAAARGERISLSECGVKDTAIRGLDIATLTKLVAAIDRSDFNVRDSILKSHA